MTAICPVTVPRQNHEERRSFHFIGIDLRFHGFQTLCTFLNELIAAKLDFNETVFAVSQMNDRIAFLSVFVSIMVNLTIQSIRKYTKVSDAKRFKEKSESL